jgi:hypothetical protein
MQDEINYQRIRRLQKRYPGHTLKELIEIDKFLKRYLEIALEIYLEMADQQSSGE